MLIKLDFKEWYKKFSESRLVIDAKNIINELKNKFGFSGEKSDDKFKQIQFRDVVTRDPGPKGERQDVDVISQIKTLGFYTSLDPKSPSDAAKINALNGLDPITATMGDVVDIMTSSNNPAL